jgi:hypothetical protein
MTVRIVKKCAACGARARKRKVAIVFHEDGSAVKGPVCLGCVRTRGVLIVRAAPPMVSASVREVLAPFIRTLQRRLALAMAQRGAYHYTGIEVLEAVIHMLSEGRA